MDQEQFNSIVALLRGLNSSGTLNTSDLSVLQNAILGVLTDTYRAPEVGQSEDELIMNYAPDLFAAADSGDPIRQQIAGAVMRGEDPLTIQVDLRKKLGLQASSGEMLTDDMPTTEEYMSLVNTYKNQWREFQKQERLNAKEKREADPFLKYGLPAFDERYQATDVNRDVFEKLASDYAARPYESKEKKYPPGQKPSSTKDLVATSATKKQTTKPTEDRVGFDALANTLFGWTKNIQNKANKTSQADSVVAQPVTSAVANRQYAPGEKLRGGTFDAEKAKLAGNSPERMERVAQALVAILQPRLDASGSTPLKDALAQRGIFSAAAAIPKKSSGTAKNYTVKGSNVVKTGK